MYDFDEIIPRQGTGCMKYEALPPEVSGKDVMPLWIADMDFRTPDFIVDAMRRRMDHPIYGYTCIPKDYFPTIAHWVEKLHGWKVDPQDIRYIPGIVKGIGLALHTFLSPGEKVIIQPPVYHPFRIVTEKNGMELLRNPLIPQYDAEGALTGYEMDFDGLQKLIDKGGKALILANPHNPAGVCWSAETLRKLAHITASQGVLVISDEIHSEMALWGGRHVPYASVSEEAASNAITFMAPSKTFNIAGIVSSYTIVYSPELKDRFFNFLDANEIDAPAIFPVIATMAAYTRGWQWREEMLAYVQSNIEFVIDYLKREIPSVKALRPQASFLIWLDCRALGMKHEDLQTFMEGKAHLFLNDGAMFGEEGDGFLRLNIATPRAVLESAMKHLKEAVDSLKTV